MFSDAFPEDSAQMLDSLESFYIIPTGQPTEIYFYLRVIRSFIPSLKKYFTEAIPIQQPLVIQQ
jgi:hypothetical protein